MAKKGAPTTATAKKRGAALKSAKSARISSPKHPSKPYDLKKTLAPDPLSPAPPSAPKTLSTVADLKDLASSGLASLKRRLETCHSDAVKEINATMSYVSKRSKVQTQACLRLAEEAEKEYKDASDKINETAKLLKASYGELVVEAQAAASRVRKVSIPELEKSMEKAIGDLRSHYKIPATSA